MKKNFFRGVGFLVLMVLGISNLPAAPEPPSALTMNPSIYDHWAHLLWQPSPSTGVAKYNIYRTTVAGFLDNVSQVGNTTALSYLDLNLDNGVIYYYRVTAVDESQIEGAPSVSTQIWTHPAAPTPGYGFQVAAVSTSSIKWVWARGTASEGVQRLVDIVSGNWVSPELDTSATTYTETLLTPGISVSSRAIVSYNVTGQARSNHDGAATLANPSGNPQFTFVGSSVAIAWDPNGNGAGAKYLVQRGFNGIDWVQIAYTTQTSLSDSALDEGATIYYRIRSENDRGVTSVFSSAISTIVERIAPAAISNLTASPGSGEGTIQLTWTATGEDDYSGDFYPPASFDIDWSTSPSAALGAGSQSEVSIVGFSRQGSSKQYLVENLNPGNTYYFGIFTMDNNRNFSKVSNIAPAWAQWDNVAPSSITTLAVSLLSDTTATLRWKTPGDNGNKGVFDGVFEVGYSSLAINTRALFNERATKVRLSTAVLPGEGFSHTLTGLVSETKLYFAVRSYDDRQNLADVSNMVLVALDNVAPPDISGLFVQTSTTTDNFNELSWNVPGSSDIVRMIVIRSSATAPSRALIKKGMSLGKNQSLSDNSLVLSTITASMGASVRYQDLISGVDNLYTTFYYLIISSDAVGNLSSGTIVSTVLRENVSPREPYGVVAQKGSGSVVLISWMPPRFNSDGSAIVSAQAPRPHEVSAYELYSSSTPNGPWYLWTTIEASISSIAVRTTGLEYFRFQSIDAYGNRSRDASMIVDSLARVSASVPGGKSYLSLPSSLASYLRPSGNPKGLALRLKSEEVPQDERGITYTAVRFWAEDVDSGQEVKNLTLPESTAKVVLHYSGNASGEVASASAASLAAPLVKEGVVRLEDAHRSLGLYWHNGQNRVKVYGDVDKTNQTISMETANLGSYYVQKLYREAAFDFDVTQVEPRVLTPNGDGRNDIVILRFNNPKDSSITGRIFDLSGSYVADLSNGPASDTKMWDGRDHRGAYAPSGVYLYQLEAEGQIFNGTLAVAR